jgi:hypothetical protein
MKKQIIVILNLFFCVSLLGQVKENIYAAANIPQELLKGAYAVVRKYDVRFNVTDIGTAFQEEHKIITILNEQGRYLSTPAFQYDNEFSFIEDIEAAIYDAAGKIIRKVKKKDIEDFKPFEMSVDDNRIKKINFPYTTYPYTIEYTVKTKNKGSMFYPTFEPQNDNEVSVEDANLTIILPTGSNLRYKEFNIKDRAEISDNTYKWRFSSIKTFRNEGFSTYWNHFPQIITAPTDFKMGEYKGDMRTWQSFGDFLFKLGEGRQVLDEPTKKFIREMVADCKSDVCKVEKIYAHLQNTTRYFSIQLGIGGWQTIAANDVNRRKYGDCKALSNYMVAMLEAVNIRAHSVLIKAGSESRNKTQYPDFANAQFNHMIACVPMPKDTLWLECTSQTESCGFLGEFTSDRPALLITPEGGKLVRTPKYNEDVNFIKRNAAIKLDSLGKATVEADIKYSGIKQDLALYLARMGADARKKIVSELLELDNATVSNLTFEQHSGRIPTVTQKIALTVEPFASKSGKRLFLPINIFSKWTKTPVSDEARTLEVQAHDYSFMEQDSVLFELPNGYKLETKPVSISLSSDFGSFEMSVTEKSPSEYIFYRKLILNDSIQPKEKFNDLAEFLKKVSKADKTKLVLVKLAL